MGLTLDPTDAALYAYSTRLTGTVFGLFSAGAIFGALFVGWLCDVYGRKRSLLAAAAINIVGGALQTGSVNIGMFIAARFITGFAGGTFSCLLLSLSEKSLTPMNLFQPCSLRWCLFI